MGAGYYCEIKALYINLYFGSGWIANIQSSPLKKGNWVAFNLKRFIEKSQLCV